MSTPPRTDTLRPRLPFATGLWAAWVVAFCAFNAILPRDGAFDVLHYHVHNGWAFAEGRFETDRAPAELHSFLNPLYQAGAYWLMTHLPGRAVAMTLALPQALTLPALYLFARALFARLGRPLDPVHGVLVALLGFSSVLQLELMGSLRNDPLGALAFILAMWRVLAFRCDRPGWTGLLLASGFLGMTLGLKLTNVVYVAGFAVAVAFVDAPLRSRGLAILMAGLSGFLGVLATGAYWHGYLWLVMGNPVFPHMNELFQAPAGPDMNFRDVRYLPDSLWEGLWRPIAILFDGQLVDEYQFFDPRLQLGLVAALGFVVAGLWRRRAFGFGPVFGAGLGFLTLVAVWIALFSIKRYALGAWLVGPVLLAGGLLALLPPGRATWLRVTAGLAVAVSVLMTVSETAHARRVAWRALDEPYVWVRAPDSLSSPNPVVIMTGELPTAFTALGLPEEATAVSLVPQDWAEPPMRRLFAETEAFLQATERPLYVVLVSDVVSADVVVRKLRERHRLQVEIVGCRRFETAFDGPAENWSLCPVRRIERSLDLRAATPGTWSLSSR